jgi:hypothetical protein
LPVIDDVHASCRHRSSGVSGISGISGKASFALCI